MIGSNRATTSNFTCTPFFPFHIRIVGTDVYAAVTIRLRGYGSEHAEQTKYIKY